MENHQAKSSRQNRFYLLGRKILRTVSAYWEAVTCLKCWGQHSHQTGPALESLLRASPGQGHIQLRQHSPGSVPSFMDLVQSQNAHRKDRASFFFSQIPLQYISRRHLQLTTSLPRNTETTLGPNHNRKGGEKRKREMKRDSGIRMEKEREKDR